MIYINALNQNLLISGLVPFYFLVWYNGITKQYSFGQESEIILQQGTKFKIKKIEKLGGKLYFDLDVIEQKPQY